MIVVDASVIVAGMLAAGASRELLSRRSLQVPHLADAEVASALRANVRHGTVSAAEGWEALRAWSGLGVHRHPTFGLAPRVWELRDSLSAYDATYVALAEALECPLATSDLRLAGAHGMLCEIVTPLS